MAEPHQKRGRPNCAIIPELTSDRVALGGFWLCQGAAKRNSAVVCAAGSNCLSGGTMTANNVTVNMSSSSTTGTSFNVSMSMNGPFSFSSCSTYGYDYSRLPTVAYSSFVVSGDITVNGSWASSVTPSGGTATGSSSVNARYSSSNLVVNGTAVSMDVTDTTSYNYTTSGSGNTITLSFTGTVRLNGTANGVVVATDVPVSQTITCTISGTSVNCI